jgi:hypothetical protein
LNPTLKSITQKVKIKNYLVPKVNKELWKASYALKSAINMETGKELPIPARMSAFVPMNIPIAFGLICLPATRGNIMFFNWLNQTYNAGMNYANSSGKEDSLKYTAISYSMAVASSIGVAMLLKRYFSKYSNPGLFRSGLIRLMPSSAAGFLNLFFMRSDYVTKGIDIKDKEGNQVGMSKRCGIKAVLEGAFSRCFLPVPLLANHVIVTYLNTLGLPRNLKLLIEIVLCAIALAIGLPASIGLFKQYSTCSVDKLEPELRDKLKLQGVDEIYYNKGL